MGAKMIWIDSHQISRPRMVYFKKNVYLSQEISKCIIKICADSRYVLTINNNRVSTGPCRAPKGIWYYDLIDISPFVQKGNNEIFVKVIQYADHKQEDISFKTGPISVTTEGLGYLKIEEIETDLGISTSNEYMCVEEKGYLFPENQVFGYLSFFEYFDNRERNMMLDNNCWSQAVQLFEAPSYDIGAIRDRWHATERTIPLPYEEVDVFRKIYRNTFSPKEDKLVITSGESAYIELDAGRLVNAYPRIKFSCGEGSIIKITYAEGYSQVIGKETVKCVRDDWENHQINGPCDIYISHSGEQEYIPFLYRNFRVVKVEVTAKGKEPFVLDTIDYIKTGYPLRVTGSFVCDNTDYNKIWEISIRTLRRCMHETYMDCPFYEQMQYVMDTYLQIQYTFSISADGRLARKAICDFAQAQLSDGMIPCNSPAKFNQIIPGFPIYWIFMLESYMMYVGDREFIRSHLGNMDRLIQYYRSYMDDNNLLGNTGYWQFFDWVAEWKNGCPVRKDEVNILYNMLFVYGLRAAAKLNKYCNRDCIAREYEGIAQDISNAINECAYDKEIGLYSDAPGRKPSSQHAQIFAVLSSVAPEKIKKDIIKKMIENKESLAKPSYCFSYFLCRALEEADLYNELNDTLKVWDMFTNLMQYNLTTWPEDFVTMRSDCHGWSAIALYEFSACFLGVKPLTPGYSKVQIKPLPCLLDSYSGWVPVGENKVVKISVLKDEKGKKHVDVNIPDGIEYVCDFSKLNDCEYTVRVI